MKIKREKDLLSQIIKDLTELRDDLIVQSDAPGERQSARSYMKTQASGIGIAIRAVEKYK